MDCYSRGLDRAKRISCEARCKQIWLAAPTILAHEHIFAAIAQPVERILGKDEVASSNLASSSIKRSKPFGFDLFICADRFEQSNASVRWTLAGDGSTEPNIYFLPYGKKMQTNLASSSQTPDSEQESGVFLLSCCSFKAGFEFAEQLNFQKT